MTRVSDKHAAARFRAVTLGGELMEKRCRDLIDQLARNVRFSARLACFADGTSEQLADLESMLDSIIPASFTRFVDFTMVERKFQPNWSGRIVLMGTGCGSMVLRATTRVLPRGRGRRVTLRWEDVS